MGDSLNIGSEGIVDDETTTNSNDIPIANDADMDNVENLAHNMHVMMWIHIFIWLWVILAGLVHPKLARINMFVLLPMIYFLQILPFNILVSIKMQYIVDHWDDLKQWSSPCISIDDLGNEERQDLIKLAHRMGLEVSQTLLYFSVYLHFENDDFIARWLKSTRAFFDRHGSFKNPASTQGMLVIGFIINGWALCFHENRY